MPYMGALKAYVMMPIFWLFGVSTTSVRLPMILLTALALVFLWGIVRKHFGAKIAIGVTLLLAIDPHFIAITRTDFGPVVIALLLQVLSLGVVFTYIRDHKIARLLWLLPLFALGIFNKLDFLWFINAVFGAVFLLNVSTLRTFIKRRLNVFVAGALVVGYTFFAAFYLWMLRLGHLVSGISLHTISANLAIWANNLAQLMSGEAFYQYAFAGRHTIFTFVFATLVALVPLVGFYYVHADREHRGWRPIYDFLVLVCVLIAAQILITAEATGPWHVFHLVPMLGILVVLSGFAIYRSVSSTRSGKIIRIALVILGLAQVAHLLTVQWLSVRKYEDPALGYWTPAIYELLAHTKPHPPRLVAGDWGIGTQLVTFDHQPDKYLDGWAMLNDFPPEKTPTILKYYLDPRRGITYIFFAPGFAGGFPSAREHIFSTAEHAGLKMLKVYEIKYHDQVVYQLYRALDPKHPEWTAP